jgi:hypothetical protein
MRFTSALRNFSPLAMMAIWLLVASAMVPAPAGATLMEYTYTGANFMLFDGTFPSTPAIGSNLNIQFTYDGPIPDSGAVITDFTITCGELQLSLSPGDITSSGDVLVASNGLPVYWVFLLRVDPYDIESWWTRNTGHQDRIIYSGPGGEAQVIAFSSGTWTAAPVPLPPTALLLASGLIPLVWFRRRNLLGK